MRPVFRGAIRLAGQLLQFDGFSEGGVTFVSHAHVPIPRDAGQLITSDLTARLLGPRAARSLVTPYGRRFSLGELELRLLPTGHVPGSAALEVRFRRRTFTYAGDVGSYGEFFGIPAAAPEPCHELVLASTYGRSRYAFPAPKAVLARICEFCRQAAAQGCTPVLLCHPLGKAQALTTLLHEAGFTTRLHRSMHRSLKPLRELGVRVGPARRFDGRVLSGEVLLWPIRLWDAPALRSLPQLRRGLVSGRAVEPSAVAGHGCEAGFPLSDLADRARLLKYVAAANPRRVYLIPGQEEGIDRALARRGIEVRLLGPPTQLQLFGG